MFNNDEWLEQVSETVIEPERDIVDPHHHLWPQTSMGYNINELLADTSDGHAVSQTVFMECGAAYRKEGPDFLRCVGETAFVAQAASIARAQKAPTQIAGIVAHADLCLAQLDDVLDAHEEAAEGLFRGIRHAGASAGDIEGLAIPGGSDRNLMSNEAFRAGVARLGERGLTYDSWLYHFQINDFVELARAVPATTMILDHFGTPLGVGEFAHQKDAIFEQWKEDIERVAACPNVFAKLGGLAMPDNGFGWHERATPPSSDEFVEAQSGYYEHAIACFGVDRCMFESNFPVDRLSIGYRVLWNGLKKMTINFSEEEKDLLFSGVARRVYRIDAA